MAPLGFVDRNQLWARLNGAVREAGGALPTPVCVVDLDAFDANAADLVRRAGGKPVRVATKSLRVPALIRAGAARRRASAGCSATPCARRCGCTSRASATTCVVAYPTVDRARAARAGRLAAAPRPRSR